MVAANRMLNRALGIKGDRSHNKASTADSTNNESLKGRTNKSDAQDHFTRNKAVVIESSFKKTFCWSKVYYSSIMYLSKQDLTQIHR